MSTPDLPTGAGPGVLHDVRLVPAALLSWAAAWWAVAADPGHSRAAAAAVLVLGLVGVVGRPVLRGRRQVLPVLVVACACAAPVLALTSWQVDRRGVPAVAQVAQRSGVATVEVVVVGDPVTGRGTHAWQREQQRVRAVVVGVRMPADASARPPAPTNASARSPTSSDASSDASWDASSAVPPDVSGGGSRHVQVAVRVPVSLTAAEGWEDARWGERRSVVVRLGPAPPGAPEAYRATAVGPATVVAQPRWWWRAAERLRAGLLTAAHAHVDPAADGGPVVDGAALLPGLVVGDTSRQPGDLVEDMRTAGLSHLTAVSGANVTITCGGVLLLCVLLRLPRRVAVALAGLALVGLVVVARPEPSVLRASVMGVVGLVGLLLGRRGGGLSALALAVVAVVMVDPWLARAPGLRLSVLATAGLVVWSMPWARAMGRVLPRTVALSLAVPAAAQVAVTPTLVGLDPAVSLYALPANVLVAPAVAPATVVGLVAALVSVLHEPSAGVLALPAVWSGAWIALVARTTADLPAALLPWPDGPVGVVAAGGAGLLVVVVARVALRVLPDRRDGRAWAPWPRPRRRPGAAVVVGRVQGSVAGPVAGPVTRVVVATVVVAAVVAFVLPARSGWPGPGWAVVVCDVGQGESLLVRTGPASAVVVDTGPEPADVRRCLRRAGVRHVPLLVLTHLHADHVGGLPGLSAEASVARVWSPGAGMPEDAAGELAAWATGAPAPLEHPVAGTVVQVGGVRVEVLAPSGATGTSGAGDSQDVNDSGLVVRLVAPGVTVLAVGDIGSQVQQRLLATGVTLRADLTTVAHHGSADQHPAFYRAVGAGLAVASAGRDNTYGHPSPRALEVVGDAGSTVLSTAAHGAVALRPVRVTGDPEATSLAVRTTRAAPRRRRLVPAWRRG